MHLTERNAPMYGQPVVSNGSEAAGAPEVKITKKMIVAGTEVFYRRRGLEFGDGEDAVHSIFTAMALAAPKSVASRLSYVQK
jgi:hypothetical protein